MDFEVFEYTPHYFVSTLMLKLFSQMCIRPFLVLIDKTEQTFGGLCKLALKLCYSTIFYMRKCIFQVRNMTAVFFIRLKYCGFWFCQLIKNIPFWIFLGFRYVCYFTFTKKFYALRLIVVSLVHYVSIFWLFLVNILVSFVNAYWLLSSYIVSNQ